MPYLRHSDRQDIKIGLSSPRNTNNQIHCGFTALHITFPSKTVMPELAQFIVLRALTPKLRALIVRILLGILSVIYLSGAFSTV
jgi:hypothetical protein